MDEHEKDAGGHDEHIEKVRRRAHAIWLDQGMVHGRDQEHWHEAEREIAAEQAGHTSSKAVEPAESSEDVEELSIKGSAVEGAEDAPPKAAGESPLRVAGDSPAKAA